MPAVFLWDDAYLRSYVREADLASTTPFWAILKGSRRSTDAFTRRLSEPLLPDCKWRSAFSDVLTNISSNLPFVWASEGGKRTALHYDAVDNMHVRDSCRCTAVAAN